MLRTLTLALCAVLLVAPPAAAQDEDTAATESDTRARALMKQMAEYIAGLKSFRFEAHTAYDAVQSSGQTLEFGGIRQTQVRRPDRVRVRFDDREGGLHELIFDGKRLVFYSPRESFYAEESYEGNLDGALDHAVDQLNQPAPLADFVRAGFWQDVGPTIQSALVVGEATVEGVACHHLAFQSAELDWQVWIAREQPPLPRRVVITYNTFEGSPQFRARFVRWDVSPSLPDTVFAFDPGSAERIPIEGVGPAEEPEAGELP